MRSIRFSSVSFSLVLIAGISVASAQSGGAPARSGSGGQGFALVEGGSLDLPNSSGIHSASIFDLDGDGTLDQVVGHSHGDGTSPQFSVLLNTGGGLKLARGFSVSDSANYWPVTAMASDLDGSGVSRLVIAQRPNNFASSSLMPKVIVGKLLEGEFASEGGVEFNKKDANGKYLPLVALDLVDIDRDGKSDIMALLRQNYPPIPGGPSYLAISRGLGDANFEAPIFIPTTASPGAVSAKDINGDGWLDVVVLGSDKDQGSMPEAITANVAVHLSNKGKIQKAKMYPSPLTGQQAVFTGLGDLDGDSHPDAVGFLESNPQDPLFMPQILVLWGSAAGEYRQMSLFPIEGDVGAKEKAVGLTLGDLSGDGSNELVLTAIDEVVPQRSVLYVLQFETSRNMRILNRTEYDNSVLLVHPIVSDINADGKHDLTVVEVSYSDEPPSAVKILYGAGSTVIRAR